MLSRPHMGLVSVFRPCWFMAGIVCLDQVWEEGSTASLQAGCKTARVAFPGFPLSLHPLSCGLSKAMAYSFRMAGGILFGFSWPALLSSY